MEGISSVLNKLNTDKTETLIDMFRGKCQDENVSEYVVEKLVNTRNYIEVANKFSIKELDDLLLRKWMDGEVCSRHFSLQHFSRCTRHIYRLKSAEDWSEEQEAEF